MTTPWQHNCPHSPNSWCLACVEQLANDCQVVRQQAESEVERLYKVNEDLVTKNAKLQADLTRMTELAKRCYPGLKASGLCSAHRSDSQATWCPQCYPDLRAIIRSVSELRQAAEQELENLRRSIT